MINLSSYKQDQPQMKKIFIAVMLITLFSCQQEVENSKQTSISFGHLSPLQIVEVNHCQYLYGDWGNESVFTHKGDCNNPIHKPKSE